MMVAPWTSVCASTSRLGRNGAWPSCTTTSGAIFTPAVWYSPKASPRRTASTSAANVHGEGKEEVSWQGGCP
jgi:hypothetical protein